MKKLCLILSVVFFATQGFANPFAGAIPSGMETEVNMLLTNPETRDFIYSVQGDKPIVLKWVPMGNKGFNAFWASNQRFVGLNSSKAWTQGDKMFSILFELNNAYATPRLHALDQMAAQSQISKPAYVQGIETIEYENVMRTTQFLKNGIYSGYFPANMRLPNYPPLQEHLAYQYQTGHSGFLEKKYDDLRATS